MATSDNPVIKAIAGDEDQEVIKAGTLAVTRGVGVLSAAAVVLTNVEWPFDDLTSVQKLTASLVILGIWAFLASADALARAYATGNPGRRIQALPTPLDARLQERKASDERGWKVYLIRVGPSQDDGIEYFVVKGEEALWLEASKVQFV